MAYVSVVPPSPRLGRYIPGRPIPRDLQGLGQRKKRKRFGRLREILKPIYRPIVAAVKPMLRPLIAMVPGVGPAAAIAFTAVQAMRRDAKAAAQVAQQVQQAPSWGQLTLAQQQAILNAVTAGVTPSVQAPPDVVAAYQQAVQQQAAAHPEWSRPPGAPAPPPPSPWEAPAEAPAEAAAGMGMGGILGIGAAAVGAMMLLGGGRRRG